MIRSVGFRLSGRTSPRSLLLLGVPSAINPGYFRHFSAIACSNNLIGLLVRITPSPNEVGTAGYLTNEISSNMETNLNDISSLLGADSVHDGQDFPFLLDVARAVAGEGSICTSLERES
jgi:hypothetical protein